MSERITGYMSEEYEHGYRDGYREGMKDFDLRHAKIMCQYENLLKTLASFELSRPRVIVMPKDQIVDLGAIKS